MSSLSVIPNPYGAKIYNVSVGKSLPQWLSEKKKKSLRYDEDYRRRVELIQDFEFPTAAQKIKVTPNKEFIVASGVYPPQIRVYEVGQLSMKFERHADFEIVDFEILSEDYSKLALLRADRTIEFHARYGKHYTVRIPKHGRDILYDYSSCDLFICGASSEIYRMNLEIGQFLQPFDTQLSQSGWNVMDQNPLHYNLLCAGSDDGVVQCWDTRMRSKIASKDIVSDLIAKTMEDFNDKDVGIESLKFDIDGLTLGVGTSTGHCLLYDLRASHPFLVKDHQYGLPIKQIHFHHGGVGPTDDALGLTDIHVDSVGSTGSGKLVLTSDSKVMKLWNRDNNGKIHASLECPCDINDVCVFDSSGLLLVAGEQPKMMAYFIPSLGPAPKWCSFLDNLTEELEEDKQTLYDDYKFVTRDELNRLGLGKLIGTQYLKAYMHGFFIDMKLYKKFKSIMDPFEYEEYRKSKVAEKIAQQAETRIGVKKQMPKVNAKLAARLLQSTKPNEKNKSEAAKNKKVSANILVDDRFKDLFERKDFQIDENDEKYKFYHPREQKISSEDIEEHFEKVDAEDEDKQNVNLVKGDSDDEVTIRSQIRSQKTTKTNKPAFYEVKTGHEGAISKATSAPELRMTEDKKLPFSKRVALGETQKNEDETIVKGAFGGMQVTFVPNSEKKKRKLEQEKSENWKEKAGKRRGIQTLNLPKVKVPVYKRRN